MKTIKDSPKWTTVGEAMAARGDRLWNYPTLGLALIICWPLLKRNNWTYRDLLAVVKLILPPPHRYPLNQEPELASYCQNVLGLRKGAPKGRSSPDGRPPGWEIALKLCSEEKNLS